MVLKREYYENLKLEDKNSSEVTNADMFETVWRYVSGISQLRDAVNSLYYAKPERHLDCVALVTEECEVRAVVRSGSNEGVVIEYYLEGKSFGEPRIIQLGFLKTLGEDMDSCINMGMIAGALMRAGELFLRYNLY